MVESDKPRDSIVHQAAVSGGCDRVMTDEGLAASLYTTRAMAGATHTRAHSNTQRIFCVQRGRGQVGGGARCVE